MAWISPDWAAPPNVGALTTTRIGGISKAPFASLNLGMNCGDAPADVIHNRRLVADQVAAEELLATDGPQWLAQHHGSSVECLTQYLATEPEADAALTSTRGLVLAVQTADCLPVLICNSKGTMVAAVHAGWRGLAADIICKTAAHFKEPAEQLNFWLGPAIGQTAYEVGSEVKLAFAERTEGPESAFVKSDNGKWLCSLYALARNQIRAIGGVRISGGEYCTFAQDALFYSYRRDGVTGRMATLVWIRSSDY